MSDLPSLIVQPTPHESRSPSTRSQAPCCWYSRKDQLAGALFRNNPALLDVAMALVEVVSLFPIFPISGGQVYTSLPVGRSFLSLPSAGLDRRHRWRSWDTMAWREDHLGPPSSPTLTWLWRSSALPMTVTLSFSRWLASMAYPTLRLLTSITGSQGLWSTSQSRHHVRRR